MGVVAASTTELQNAFAAVEADVPLKAVSLLVAAGFTLDRIEKRGAKVLKHVDLSGLNGCDQMEVEAGVTAIFDNAAGAGDSPAATLNPVDASVRAAVAFAKQGGTSDGAVKAGMAAGSVAMEQREKDAGTHIALVNVLKSGVCVTGDTDLRGGKNFKIRERSEMESMADGFGRVIKGDKWKQYVDTHIAFDGYVSTSCNKLDKAGLAHCGMRLLQWWLLAARLMQFPGEDWESSTQQYVKEYLERNDCQLPVVFDESLWREIKDSRKEGDREGYAAYSAAAPSDPLSAYFRGAAALQSPSPQLRDCFLCGSREHLIGGCPHRSLAEFARANRGALEEADTSGGKKKSAK